MVFNKPANRSYFMRAESEPFHYGGSYFQGDPFMIEKMDQFFLLVIGECAGLSKVMEKKGVSDILEPIIVKAVELAIFP